MFTFDLNTSNGGVEMTDLRLGEVTEEQLAVFDLLTELTANIKAELKENYGEREYMIANIYDHLAEAFTNYELSVKEGL